MVVVGAVCRRLQRPSAHAPLVTGELREVLLHQLEHYLSSHAPIGSVRNKPPSSVTTEWRRAVGRQMTNTSEPLVCSFLVWYRSFD